MFASLIFIVAAATATPAPASATPATAPAAASAPAAKTVKVTAAADPIICEDVETTGSHMSDRQCMRKSEWAKQAQDGADDFRTEMSRANAGGMTGGPH